MTHAGLAATSLAAVLFASGAAAAPIVGSSPDAIALSDSTLVTLTVDTNDTALAGLQLVLTGQASGLTIESVTSGDGSVTAFGPAVDQGVWSATLQGLFLPARPPGTLIAVGTVRVRGLEPGAVLRLATELTPLDGSPIVSGPSVIATVVPEPGSLALLALGLAAVARARRSA